MRSLLSILFALAALCSCAIAATPITLTAGNVQTDGSEEQSHSHSRGLLGKVGKYAQCGGRGMNGKSDGEWGQCPAGQACVKQDFWWWSCKDRKGGSRPAPPSNRSAAARRKAAAAAKKRAAAKKKAAAAKKKKAAAKKKKAPTKKKTPPRRRSGSTRRTGSTSTRFSSIGDDYQNPVGNYGNPHCEEVKPYAFNGHWCKLPPVTGKAPSSTPDVKIGRGTVFNGPAWTQIGHCAKRLWPVDGTNSPTNNGDWRQNFVKIAVSSYYTRNFGEYPCGRKMCVQVIGYDETTNPNVPSFWRELVRNGTAMPGIVYDQCPECERDHIDFLGMYPFSPAKADQWNPFGSTANSIWSNVNEYYMDSIEKVYGVGVMKVMWGWNDDNVPCSSYF